MFQVRDDHMKAFGQTAEDNFVDRAVQHLRRRLPRETANHNDDELRARVRGGMKRAQTYGLITERQILCFVDTGVLLHEGFDTDPAYPWAGQILGAREASAEVRATSILDVAEVIARGNEA